MVIDSAIISITKVNLSSDIKLANVHISIFTSNNTNPSEILDRIIKDKKEIKYKMGLLLNAKYVPELKFHLDTSMKSYDEINNLLKK